MRKNLFIRVPNSDDVCSVADQERIMKMRKRKKNGIKM